MGISNADDIDNGGADETKEARSGSAVERKTIGPEDEKREALDGEPSAAQKVRDDFLEAEDIEASEDHETRTNSR